MFQLFDRQWHKVDLIVAMDEVTLHINCGPPATRNLADPVGRVDINGDTQIAALIDSGETALVLP